jgi:hypothetical protein
VVEGQHNFAPSLFCSLPNPRTRKTPPRFIAGIVSDYHTTRSGANTQFDNGTHDHWIRIGRLNRSSIPPHIGFDYYPLPGLDKVTYSTQRVDSRPCGFGRIASCDDDVGRHLLESRAKISNMTGMFFRNRFKAPPIRQQHTDTRRPGYTNARNSQTF